jgi:bifunctional DNA-binding transcriptional regulator/antitoxin component of YhaV-PrlF toxin-antitoxin module
LDLKPGDTVEIDAEGERIIIRKVQSSALEQLEECISDVWKEYDQELNKIREEWTGEYQQYRRRRNDSPWHVHAFGVHFHETQV